MREIKFRAYIKASGTIHDVTGLHYMGGSISEIQIFCNSVFMWYHILDVDLMQYTGLKDKNGEEIYEGDILECSDMEYLNQDDFTGTVAIEDCEFHLKDEKGKSIELWDDGSFDHFGLSLLQTNECCKIIGNIYENPELIS